MKQILSILFLFVSLHAGAQHGMLLAKPAAGGGGTTYLLDTYTGAAAAYGMNKLSSTATNCVTILRASDNDTLVVGFSGDDFDSSAATTFVSSGHGYVITWWDQSGNSYNVTQSDTSAAPLIIENGSLVTEGGEVALKWRTDDNDFFENDEAAAEFQSISAFDFFFVCGLNTYQGSDPVIGISNSTLPTILTINPYNNAGGNGVRDFFNNKERIDENGATRTGQNLFVYEQTGANSREAFVNSSSVDTNTESATFASTLNSFVVGGNYLTQTYTGTIQLVILYPSDQSANRTGIETEINTYYSIY